MKRIRTEYYCDHCGAQVDGPGIEDYHERNWCLCEACEDAGYRLRTYPLTDGCVVRMITPGAPRGAPQQEMTL